MVKEKPDIIPRRRAPTHQCLLVSRIICSHLLQEFFIKAQDINSSQTMAGDKDGINNVELAIAAIYTQRTKNQFTILTLRIINDTNKCIGDFLTRQSIYLFENIDDLCKD